MDMYNRVLCKDKKSKINFRKTSTVEGNRLQQNLRALGCSYQKKENDFQKELRMVQREMEDLTEGSGYFERETREREQTQAATRYWAEADDQAGSAKSPGLPPLTQNNDSFKCRFGAGSVLGCCEDCKHFPCKLPPSYHSFGRMYQFHPKKYSGLNLYKNFEKSPKKCFYSQDRKENHHGKQLTKPNQSDKPNVPELNVSKPSVESLTECALFYSPRFTARARENGLRLLIKEMKSRNEKNKPVPWCTNYGKPVSGRRLLKSVVTFDLHQ